MISAAVIPTDAEKTKARKAMQIPLIICGISWIFGLLTSCINPDIIDNFYKTFVAGSIEQLLLHMPNLQFVHQYLVEHNNPLRWERIASFYALNILLTPLIILFIAWTLMLIPQSIKLTWANGSYKNPEKDVRTWILVPAAIFTSVIMSFFVYWSVSEIYLMDAADKTGIWQTCTGRGCFLNSLLFQHAIHLNDSNFFTLGILLATTCYMFICTILCWAHYTVFARRFYDRVLVNRLK